MNYPFRSLEEFCDFLVSFGIVDKRAITYARKFDDFKTYQRIEIAYNQVVSWEE